MKTISEKNLSSNPGNTFGRVTNYYTPIDNIIINIRNLFGSYLGFIVELGEDGISLKIKSSRFTSEHITNDILSCYVVGQTSVISYLAKFGLTGIKMISIGNEIVVYFYAPELVKNNDINNAICSEISSFFTTECEMSSCLLSEKNDDEEELIGNNNIVDIINNPDKISGAKEFSKFVEKEIILPPELYFKATKDIDGNESIALRYKFNKPRPFGKTQEMTKSLMNIYGTGENAIWVDAFLYKDILDEELLKLINYILNMINAKKTDDAKVYSL